MTSFTFRRQFILVALLIGFAFLWHPLGIAAAPVLIDDFSAGPQTHTLTCCAATESSFAAAGLGGERDIETSLTGGSSGIQYVAASPATSSFQHIQTDTITGQTTVVWDGVDSSTAVDPIGLGGVDFTGGGSNTGLLVYINSASGSINLDFTVYSNGTDVSTATIALTTTVSNQSFSIPFTSFSVQGGAGADFTNIGAFVMDIDGSSPGPLQLSLNSLALIGYDFGDLPAAYNITTVADDGARHEISTLFLGTAVDGETDGQESANADGDDTNGLADEDSVTPVGTWVEGLNGGTVDVIASGAGCLSGWIDWDSNNNFTNFGDDVIVMTEVTAGTNTISFNIPAGGASSSVFSRFRLVPDTGTPSDCSDDTPVALTGYAANGEVEDHLLTPLFVGLSINNVTVDEFTPTATFTVTLDAIADVDVSVNYMTNDGTATAPGDYVAASGTLTITAGITNTTVSITINQDLLDELDETFTVNLSNAVNASIADGQGVGTIIDDDIPPTAVNDAYATDEDVVLTIAAPGVLGNDIDPGANGLTAILVANPSNGAISLSSDGSFVYTPTVNFFGNDSFTYRAYDGNNNSNIGTVTIDVLPINDAPIAVDDQATTTENTQAIINVLSNDIDVDITDIFTVTAVTQPTNGTTTINAGNTVTYSPTLNFNGLDIFTYTVSDGVLSDTAVVTVTVNPVNTIPQVTVAVVSPPALEGTPTQFLGTVFDPDGRPQFIPSGSTIEWDFGDGFNSSGTLTPTHTYNDNGTYTVTLTVTDAQGGIGSDTLILAVENVAPIVNAGPNQSVPENTNVSFNGSYNDPGLFDSQTIAWDFGDGTGDVDTLNPSHTYNAAGVYTVILTVTDNDGGIGTDQLIVSVGQVATIYLPLITNGNLSAPDLVIESVSITADNATIVIKNTGDQAVADGFWVDLYINPTPPPTAANQTWDQLSDEGIVWGITQIASLVPGGTLTIDLNHSSLNTELTNFSGTFTNGMEIYVQVDSADIARQTGGVLEIHEITNGAYNNIVHVTAAIGQ